MERNDPNRTILLVVAGILAVAGVLYFLRPWKASGTTQKNWKSTGSYLFDRQKKLHPGKR